MHNKSPVIPLKTRLEDYSDEKLLKALKEAFVMRDKMLEGIGGGYPLAPFLEAARRWKNANNKI